MKGVDSTSTDSTPRSIYSSHSILNNDLNNQTTIINTVSPVLMQYRYDELSYAYKKCLKLLCKKEETLKAAIHEKQLLQNKYNELLEEHKKTQKRMELLCYKYLNMQERKTEEIFQLRDVLNHAVKIIISKCAWSRITDGDDDEQLFQQFVQSLKILKYRNYPVE